MVVGFISSSRISKLEMLFQVSLDLKRKAKILVMNSSFCWMLLNRHNMKPALDLTGMMKIIWDKVFKRGPSKICGRQPLKNLKGYGLPKQILLGPLLNTLPHIW